MSKVILVIGTVSTEEVTRIVEDYADVTDYVTGTLTNNEALHLLSEDDVDVFHNAKCVLCGEDVSKHVLISLVREGVEGYFLEKNQDGEPYRLA